MADGMVQEMANQLAEECLSLQAKTGDDRLFMQLAEVLGASSQTLEEAFLTAIRTRMAELQGRAFLNRKLEEYRVKQDDA